MSRELTERLGHTFKNAALLTRALTHSSAVDGQGDNERLEFLGDRVLGLVVADMIQARFPEEKEGSLARRHAALVREETLARVARSLDIGSHLSLSSGESADKSGILADACEAVLGAVYLDGGLEPAAAIIRRYWSPLMEEDLTPPKDAKTALQEWAQARALPVPSYSITSRDGPAHHPHFTIEVRLSSGATATGCGSSKRAAEQQAAEKLLESLT